MPQQHDKSVGLCLAERVDPREGSNSCCWQLIDDDDDDDDDDEDGDDDNEHG